MMSYSLDHRYDIAVGLGWVWYPQPLHHFTCWTTVSIAGSDSSTSAFHHSSTTCSTSTLTAIEPCQLPDSQVSGCRWLFKSSPEGKLPLLSTRLVVIFPAEERHCPLTSTKLYSWWHRHIGVNNLPKVVAQLCPGGNWTHDLLTASPMPKLLHVYNVWNYIITIVSTSIG